MIDWLEMLWKAAEDHLEFDLPGEPLRSVHREAMSRTEQAEDAAPEEFVAELTEPKRWAQGSRRETQSLQNDAQRLSAADLLNVVKPDAVGAAVRSALQAEKRAEHQRTVERLYRSAAGSALTALYRRVRETVSPGQPGTPGRGSTVVVREERSAEPGLTEEGLDRSLRRDSRRYDGGMSIY